MRLDGIVCGLLVLPDDKCGDQPGISSVGGGAAVCARVDRLVISKSIFSRPAGAITCSAATSPVDRRFSKGPKAAKRRFRSAPDAARSSVNSGAEAGTHAESAKVGRNALKWSSQTATPFGHRKERQEQAERGGFEPPVGLPRLRFSRPVQSTALPPLRKSASFSSADRRPTGLAPSSDALC